VRGLVSLALGRKKKPRQWVTIPRGKKRRKNETDGTHFTPDKDPEDLGGKKKKKAC